MINKQELIIEERIAKAIYLIRDQKVMLDSDLADMYGVETRTLKQAVRRNKDRFPEDFMFELLPEEWNLLKEDLRSQNVILEDKKRGKHSKYVPFVFTEQGVAMLSSVLNSQTAIQVNISIKGSAQDNINLGTFENQFFPFPMLISDQQAIVRQLDALRAETQKLETIYQNKISNLEELKKSILQKAFTGQLTSEPLIVADVAD